MARRIKKARITHVSLCPRGKNKVPVLYKDDGTFEIETLVKDDALDDRGEVHALVYVPEMPDTDGDVAGPEVIKEAAYGFMREGAKVDLRHDLKVVSRDRAYVAESFIVQKGDPRFDGIKDRDGNDVDPTGSWGMVVKVEDPQLREAYRSGRWNGVSMFGTGEFEQSKEEGGLLDRAFHEFIKKFQTQEDDDMKPDEMQALLDKQAEKITKGLTDALAPILKKEEPPKPDEKKADEKAAPAIKFEGDPMKKEDVDKHLAKLKRAELEKSVDWSDPKSVEQHQAALAKLDKGEDDDEGDEDQDNDPDIRKQLALLQKEFDKKKRASRAPTFDPETSGISKEDRDAFESGGRMAKYINGQQNS